MMETVITSKTSVNLNPTTLSNIPGDGILNYNLVIHFRNFFRTHGVCVFCGWPALCLLDHLNRSLLGH